MMSGTSLDGVDAAEVVTDGEAIMGLGPSAYRAYSHGDRAVLRDALGRWPGEPRVEAAARTVEAAHAALANDLPGAALVGFHGQTLAHDPANRRTHQVGDGARLAGAIGRPVVWDFRTADVALGGEGAPLAPVYHHAALRWAELREPTAVLNLGGVGNLTWVDPCRDDPGEALLAFDTGPANAPIDDVCARLGQAFDAEGALARSGRARPDLARDVLSHPFFDRGPPKSLDRDAFREAGAAIDALDPPDAAATWVAVLAASVAAGLGHCPAAPSRVLVAGGGRRNHAIMAALADRCRVPVAPIEAVGLDGDMLEAQAFAYLAVRVLRGLPTSFPTTTGVAAAIGGGTIDDPRGALTSAMPRARHHGGRELARRR